MSRGSRHGVPRVRRAFFDERAIWEEPRPGFQRFGNLWVQPFGGVKLLRVPYWGWNPIGNFRLPNFEALPS